MQLPSRNILALQKLNSAFKSTSATYKYYWLLAIIEMTEEGNTKMQIPMILTTQFQFKVTT
jgi:hypothetical protein